MIAKTWGYLGFPAMAARVGDPGDHAAYQTNAEEQLILYRNGSNCEANSEQNNCCPQEGLE